MSLQSSRSIVATVLAVSLSIIRRARGSPAVIPTLRGAIMEIDISEAFKAIDDPVMFSASRAELGENAGRITWDAAKNGPLILDTEEKRQAFDSWARGFGAWSEEELAAYSQSEANALLLQFIAGDMREGDISADSTPEEWEEYRQRQIEGQASPYLFRTDDGRIFYDLGG